MTYTLCTTEKSSVAKDIARVLNATKREDGYFIGNGYIVTWCVGHLVTLSEPSCYGEQYNDRNNISVLPLIPKTFKTNVIEKVEKQFNIIKDLMHRDDVTLIVDCGDMGETGHYLQWLVREKANCTKPVKRFCATSLTDESIKHHMNNLRDINDFTGIIKGAYCKAKNDWILGMNFSRLFSSLYKENLSVGRVMTPTLYFVVKRYFDVTTFKPVPYFELYANFNENFRAKLHYENSSKFDDKNVLEQIKTTIEKINRGTITQIENKKHSTDRPQLYDITELQRDGNKLYGYSASDVLSVAQSLYEKHKVLSYPRTDSRYITTDLVPYMKIRLEQISSISKYSDISNSILQNGLNIDSNIVNNSKVTDHHALVVTENINNFNMSILSEMEQRILHLVITRMLVSFSAKYLFEETIIHAEIGKYSFMASGKTPISLGWKNTHHLLLGHLSVDEEEKDHEQLFPNLSQGQIISLKNVDLLSKKTTSPKLHTEGTLLTEMENCGSKITDNHGYRDILKGKGIGTQATRADIIKKLFDVQYMVNYTKGKTNYLVPTKKGINAIKIFPKELISPSLTAEWECKIRDVAEGKKNEDEFMRESETFFRQLFEECKNRPLISVDFKPEKVSLGSCPYCNKNVYEGKSHFYCEDFTSCNFSISKNNKFITSKTNKDITDVQLKKLISPKGLSITCSNVDGSKYKMTITVIKDKSNKFPSFDVKFSKK